jgi:putative acetyltransferase
MNGPMSKTLISDAQKPIDFLNARRLFEEYQKGIEIDLGFQNFASELGMLSEMYAPPHGCLLLAYRTDRAVGVVGLRRFDGSICEMKRLYVQPPNRGAGIGRQLALRAVERARDAGYSRIVLDTLEGMRAALHLYRSLGFNETAPYYDNPLYGAVYLALDIGPSKPGPGLAGG